MAGLARRSPFQRPSGGGGMPDPFGLYQPGTPPGAQPAPPSQPPPQAAPTPPTAPKNSYTIGGGDGFDPFETDDPSKFALELQRRSDERLKRAKASTPPATPPAPPEATPAPSTPQGQPEISAEMPLMNFGGPSDPGVGWNTAPGMMQQAPSQLPQAAVQSLAQSRNWMAGRRLY